MWKRSAAVLPGIGVSLLPKVVCPLCWPAYAALLSSIGLGFLISTAYLLPLTAAFLLLAIGTLGFRARLRRGYGPMALAIAAGAFVLYGKFSRDSNTIMYGGLTLLIAASVWNSWPRRAASCPQCVPAGEGFIQLKAEEKQS